MGKIDTAALAEEMSKEAENARNQFSLADKIAGISHRRKKLLIFTDYDLVETYNESRKALEHINIGVSAVTDPEQKERLLEQYNEAEKNSEALRTDMLATALSFHFRGIPNIALKVIRREARKAYADKSGNVPADKQELFQDFITRRAMTQVIEKIVTADGKEMTEITVEDIELLESQLPTTQWDRIDNTVNQLLFLDDLARVSTDDAGF